MHVFDCFSILFYMYYLLDIMPYIIEKVYMKIQQSLRYLSHGQIRRENYFFIVLYILNIKIKNVCSDSCFMRLL